MRKSELADDDVLNAFRLQSGPRPSTADDTASRLVRAGVLTPFQARSLLQGKHRGFRLGPYRILDHIGAGGMGQVFLAEHTRMHRLAALKVLTPRLALEPSMVERFYGEARAVSALDHPNIVRAYDTGFENGTHFLALEYIDGGSLADRLHTTNGAGLPLGQACDYIAQVADGLQHAHERGIAHRDVKPGNLLVDRTGVVKILDMGLARFFDEPLDWSSHQLAEVMGTTDYASPEQLTDCPSADHRSDIYSLGATLYHLVTGRPPFEGSTTAKLVAHHLSAVLPAHSVRPEIPEELSAVIEKMMAKDPIDRYQSANDVSTALQPFIVCDAGVKPEDATRGPGDAAPRGDAEHSFCRISWLAIGFGGALLASGGSLLTAAMLMRNPSSEGIKTTPTASDPASSLATPCQNP